MTMGRNKTPDSTPAASGGSPTGSFAKAERDLVTFYSRLTHTLENACGRDALAQRLAAFRQAAAEQTAAGRPSPALGRAFRRLGLLRAEDDAVAFAETFAGRVAEAVSRPGHNVRFLLDLFAGGDDKLALKPVCGATPQCQSCQLTRECDHFNTPRKPEMAALTPAVRLMSGNDQMLSESVLKIR